MPQTAIDRTYWASDLAGMIVDLPANCSFNSQTFTASISELAVDQTLLLVGNLTEYALHVTFPQSSLSAASIALLVPQATFSVQRPADASLVAYEVVSVSKPADDGAFTVLLKYKHTR